MEKYDVVVIGSGPGGYPAAIRAAQLGASTALVEREAVGGTCLNWGCIPTKTLIASSDLFARMNAAGELGLSAEGTSYDYAAIVKRKGKVVARLKGGLGQLLKANKVDVITGTASFAGRNRIAVDGKTAMEAGRTIIATGSCSAMPSFIPSGKRVVESRAFLDMTGLPGSMIVLGGGVIGCEFACMAAQFGVKVTVVEMLEDILLMLDADIRAELRKHMEGRLGIEVFTGAPLVDIKAGKTGVNGKFGDRTLKAELLLASVGRLPVTNGLELERAGLATTDSGHIETDSLGRTSVASVYAVGDVTAGSTQLAHAATAQGINAASDACGQRVPRAEQVVPACIFTAPEIGSVGLTEREALESGREVVTGKYSFAGLGKAMAAGETGGFVKWIADAATDQLLGAHAVGPHATELISEATSAVAAEMTAAELGRTIHCHPTFSEAWMEAAHAVHGEAIHQPPRRRK